MSETENKVVKNYIAQVKQKLPEWLKWKEEELKNVLDDLEAQLYGEARTISGNEELTDADMKEAIRRMGPPESIAKLYKNRGTPKFFLTQELNHLYQYYCRSFSILLYSLLGSIRWDFFRHLDWVFSNCHRNYNRVCLLFHGRIFTRRFWNYPQPVSYDLSIHIHWRIHGRYKSIYKTTH